MAERLAILGGQPIRTIPFLNRKTMGTNEIEAATRVINSEILSGFLAAPGSFFNGGKEVKAFEKSWAEKYGFKHAISVNSWTSGLMVAVGAVGIKPGDEVICSPYSMSASATAALFYGGIPVFADLDPETFCLDPKSIEEKITSKTKAIIVVHLFGGPADMDSIMKIAKPRGIKVIEDSASNKFIESLNPPGFKKESALIFIPPGTWALRATDKNGKNINTTIKISNIFFIYLYIYSYENN